MKKTINGYSYSSLFNKKNRNLKSSKQKKLANQSTSNANINLLNEYEHKQNNKLNNNNMNNNNILYEKNINHDQNLTKGIESLNTGNNNHEIINKKINDLENKISNIIFIIEDFENNYLNSYQSKKIKEEFQIITSRPVSDYRNKETDSNSNNSNNAKKVNEIQKNYKQCIINKNKLEFKHKKCNSKLEYKSNIINNNSIQMKQMMKISRNYSYLNQFHQSTSRLNEKDKEKQKLNNRVLYVKNKKLFNKLKQINYNSKSKEKYINNKSFEVKNPNIIQNYNLNIIKKYNVINNNNINNFNFKRNKTIYNAEQFKFNYINLGTKNHYKEIKNKTINSTNFSEYVHKNYKNTFNKSGITYNSKRCNIINYDVANKLFGFNLLFSNSDNNTKRNDLNNLNSLSKNSVTLSDINVTKENNKSYKYKDYIIVNKTFDKNKSVQSKNKSINNKSNNKSINKKNKEELKSSKSDGSSLQKIESKNKPNLSILKKKVEYSKNIYKKMIERDKIFNSKNKTRDNILKHNNSNYRNYNFNMSDFTNSNRAININNFKDANGNNINNISNNNHFKNTIEDYKCKGPKRLINNGKVIQDYEKKKDKTLSNMSSLNENEFIRNNGFGRISLFSQRNVKDRINSNNLNKTKYCFSFKNSSIFPLNKKKICNNI